MFVFSSRRAVVGFFGRHARFMSDDKTSLLRNQLLEASLRYVDKHGWSEESIACGAKDLGITIMQSRNRNIFARGQL